METLQIEDSITKSKSPPPVPITLKFEDICYSVSLKPHTRWWDFKSWGSKIAHHAEEKPILNNVVGLVKPGEMLAVVGPTGSGKTTLLNLLGGRLKGHVTGKILYNDLPYDKAIKRKTGFVTQEDILFPHLTVKETLVYAALLKLPREFSREEKIQRAKDVIIDLGLEKCKDMIVGSRSLRGVSRGERKRVSIGHELLLDPSLLLLDEPTSGLNSNMTFRIFQILQDLARSGRTIVTTMHQRSNLIFHMFDKVLLLSEGHTLYFGLRSEVMSYFASVGFRPLYHTNPADFLLDLADGVSHDIDTSGIASTNTFISAQKEGRTVTDIRITLREAYVNTMLVPNEKSLAPAVDITADQRGALGVLEKSKWPTSWWEQSSVLIIRRIKERRPEALPGPRVCQILALSILCGLLWWQSSPKDFRDQVGLLFFVTMFWGIFPLFTSIITFSAERSMLSKERASGMYRLTAYFFARTVADFILDLILPAASVTIVYWMAGLKASAAAFFSTSLTVLLVVLVAQGLGLLLSAAVTDVKRATALAPVIVLTFQLAAGFFLEKPPAFIGWVRYLAFPFYGHELQMKAQYSDTQTYDCCGGQCRIVDHPLVKGRVSAGFCVMAMFIMLIGYRFLAYLVLRNTK
ncbi:hypothetical protein R1sor_015135 [Riccia sorocarpa]|uniref:ABC transporter domain-containing protein n=1 Tax=Riccia sorocarpa TaxID=122646 RepID=A0ABD3HFN8_9MARC